MVSARTQATLLLTTHLTTSTDESAKQKPLDVSEWNKLARWLDAAGVGPEDLVTGDPSVILEAWVDVRIGKERLLGLLDRGHAVALSLDRWLSTGMWILSRSDPVYPERLKRRLGASAPPILFGYGDERRLAGGGVAIVGSRNAEREALQRAEAIGAKVCEDGNNVVSGGARGIDETATKGAFHGDGTAIVVLADSLLKNATKKHYRDALMAKNLALITPYSPEAGFNAGNAMGRNKLIYCLADAAIVVSSSNGSGGTFIGALENLKKGWVPLWVVPAADPDSGNSRLVDQGGRWLPELRELRSDQLFSRPESPHPGTPVRLSMYSLFDAQPMKVPSADLGELSNSNLQVINHVEASQERNGIEPHLPALSSTAEKAELPSLFQCFMEHWRRLDDGPRKVSVLAQAVGLTTKQTQEWLIQAEREGMVRKLAKPVRYELVSRESVTEKTMGSPSTS